MCVGFHGKRGERHGMDCAFGAFDFAAFNGARPRGGDARDRKRRAVRIRDSCGPVSFSSLRDRPARRGGAV